MEIKADRPIPLPSRLEHVAAEQLRANQRRLLQARTELHRYREAMVEKRRAEQAEIRAAHAHHAQRRKAEARRDEASRGADRVELSDAGRALAEASEVEVEAPGPRLAALERAHADGTLFDPERLERAARRLLGG